MLKYVKGEYNGDTSKVKNSDQGDDKSRNNIRYSQINSKQSRDKPRISRNDRLSYSLSKHNNRSSSNTTPGKNGTSKKSGRGLDNTSSFFIKHIKNY